MSIIKSAGVLHFGSELRVASQVIELYEESVIYLPQLAHVLASRLSVPGLPVIEIAPLFEKVAAEAECWIKLRTVPRNSWWLRLKVRVFATANKICAAPLCDLPSTNFWPPCPRATRPPQTKSFRFCPHFQISTDPPDSLILCDDRSNFINSPPCRNGLQFYAVCTI